MDILILLGSFTVLCALGVPVAYSLGLAAICGALWIDLPLEAIMLKISDGTDGDGARGIACECDGHLFPARALETGSLAHVDVGPGRRGEGSGRQEGEAKRCDLQAGERHAGRSFPGKAASTGPGQAGRGVMSTELTEAEGSSNRIYRGVSKRGLRPDGSGDE